MQYFELTPAYGRDYKTKAEVIAAFNAQHDFDGDYSLGFKLVNKQQLPLGCTVNIRYKQNRNIAVVKLK